MSASPPSPCRIAMVIFPRMTQLDLTGPFEVLARMRRPAASEQILSALDDPEPQVRMAAVEALGHLGNRNGDRKLAAMARSDSDASVRRAAKTALKR